MTALSSKMSYPAGMSSTYQSYQPIQHSGFSSATVSAIQGNYQHQNRLGHHQQYTVSQKTPASFPYSNNIMQTNGNQLMYGIPQTIDSAHPTIKTEPGITPPDPLDVSQLVIQNNGAAKPMNFYTEVSPSQPKPPPDLAQHGGLNSSISSKPMNFYKEISPSQPEPLGPDLSSQHHIINNSSSKPMDSHIQARPPGPDLSSHHHIISNSSFKPMDSHVQARPPGAIHHPHGVVSTQFPRTFIPPQQPFVSNAPRAPTNFGVTRLTQSIQNNVPNLVNNSQNSDRLWVVTAKEFQRYSVLFRKADHDRDGYVTGVEVRDMFIRTGLSQKHLIHIWDLVDTKQEGRLNCEQFALAMWFTMRTAQQNIEPPTKLTPEMMPPSMRVKAPVICNVKPYTKKETFNKPNDMSRVTVKPNMVTIHRDTLPPGMIPPPIRVKAPVVSNFKPYKKENFATSTPKATPKKPTPKKTKTALPPKDDVFGCPNCLMMYDDSQHSPRELPCKHTFCIDCIDDAIHEDVVKCGICGVSHTTLAAADFPINVVVEDLVRRSLEEKTEEERKKIVHDSDACFFCVYECDEPPRKRIKIGDKKVISDKESSQENNSSVGSEMVITDTDKTNEIRFTQNENISIRDTCNENDSRGGCEIDKTGHGKSRITDKPNDVGDTHNENNTIKDICNESNSREACEIDKADGKSEITGNTTVIGDYCNDLNKNLNSSVLENDTQGKENDIVAKELPTLFIDTIVSNKQNVVKNGANIEESNVDVINSNENTMNNKLTTVENIASKSVKSSVTVNQLGTKYMDRLSSEEMFVENSKNVNTNNDYQRSTANKSKNDENMNSLSVDKFLEELL